MYSLSLKILICLASFVALCRAFIVSDREYSKILTVSNGGQYGSWGEPEFCPLGTFASGYSMKIESNQLFGDDTALNAIRLICSSPDDRYNTTLQMTSTSGPFGTWTKAASCKLDMAQPLYMTSFKLQVEAPQGDGDDTTANFVEFGCGTYGGNENSIPTTMVLAVAPSHGTWGTWSQWSASCDVGQAICGLSSKVQGGQGSGDDTALNDVMFYCCP